MLLLFVFLLSNHIISSSAMYRRKTAFVHFVNTFPIPFCSTPSVLNILMEWTLKIVLSDELFELDAGIRKQVVSFAE